MNGVKEAANTAASNVMRIKHERRTISWGEMWNKVSVDVPQVNLTRVPTWEFDILYYLLLACLAVPLTIVITRMVWLHVLRPVRGQFRMLVDTSTQPFHKSLLARRSALRAHFDELYDTNEDVTTSSGDSVPWRTYLKSLYVGEKQGRTTVSLYSRKRRAALHPSIVARRLTNADQLFSPITQSKNLQVMCDSPETLEKLSLSAVDQRICQAISNAAASCHYAMPIAAIFPDLRVVNTSIPPSEYAAAKWGALQLHDSWFKRFFVRPTLRLTNVWGFRHFFNLFCCLPVVGARVNPVPLEMKLQPMEARKEGLMPNQRHINSSDLNPLFLQHLLHYHKLALLHDTVAIDVHAARSRKQAKTYEWSWVQKLPKGVQEMMSFMGEGAKERFVRALDSAVTDIGVGSERPVSAPFIPCNIQMGVVDFALSHKPSPEAVGAAIANVLDTSDTELRVLQLHLIFSGFYPLFRERVDYIPDAIDERWGFTWFGWYLLRYFFTRAQYNISGPRYARMSLGLALARDEGTYAGIVGRNGLDLRINAPRINLFWGHHIVNVGTDSAAAVAR